MYSPSLVPRPLPVFQCYTQKMLKNWEWPGDKAIVQSICDLDQAPYACMTRSGYMHKMYIYMHYIMLLPSTRGNCSRSVAINQLILPNLTGVSIIMITVLL